MDVAVGLLLLAGGDCWPECRPVLPEVVAVHIRLLTLRDGMSQKEVGRWLGLSGRTPLFASATIQNQSVTDRIGRDHVLTLCYSLPDGGGNTRAFRDYTYHPKP